MAIYNPGIKFTPITSTVESPRIEIHGDFTHAGNDWAAPTNTPIPAAADGKVILRPYEAAGYGYYVVVEHRDKNNNRVYTLYAQMNGPSPLLKNAEVKKGDIVGYSGKTGETATGAHLHFEIRQGTNSDSDYIGYGDFYNRQILDPRTYDFDQIQSESTQAQESDQINSNTDSTAIATDDTTADQDNRPVNQCTTITACTEDEFIIQIMGKDHPTEQRVIIVDENDNEIKLTKKETVNKTDQVLLSTLHIWDWNKLKDKASKLKAYLEISTTQGKPIRLLLTEKITITPRETDKQHNQIIPFMPITFVKNASDVIIHQNDREWDSKAYTENLGVPALAKQGYLYILKGTRLWRELKIEQTNSGKTYYKDINLSQYLVQDNQGKSILIDEERKVTGAELKEIWLPSSIYQNDINDFNLFYSEVQLSHSRLNRLIINKKEYETHPKTELKTLAVDKGQVQKRTKKITGTNWLSEDESTSNARITAAWEFRNTAVLATDMQKQQPRNLAAEYTLEKPGGYLYDTDGSYFTKSLTAARKFDKDNQSVTPTENAQNIELTAWLHAIEERRNPVSSISKLINGALGKNIQTPPPVGIGILKADQIASPSPLNVINQITEMASDINKTNKNYYNPSKIATVWDNPPTLKITDDHALSDAHKREIYTLYVDDTYYRLQQIKASLLQCRKATQVVMADISERKYSDCALLIQQLVSPKDQKDSKGKLTTNKLHKNISCLSEQGAKKLAYSSGVFERLCLMARYQNMQLNLIRHLNYDYVISVLADHLSQYNCYRYTAAYTSLVNTLNAVSTSPRSLDPYIGNDDVIYYGAKNILRIYTPYAGSNFLNNIISTPTSSLHKFLYEPLDTKALTDVFSKKDYRKLDCGLGYVKLGLLKECSEQKDIPKLIIDNYDMELLNYTAKSMDNGQTVSKTAYPILFSVVANTVSTVNSIMNTAYLELKKLNLQTVNKTIEFNTYKIAFDDAQKTQINLEESFNQVKTGLSETGQNLDKTSQQQKANTQRQGQLDTDAKNATAKRQHIAEMGAELQGKQLAHMQLFTQALMETEGVQLIGTGNTGFGSITVDGAEVHVYKMIELNQVRHLFGEELKGVYAATVGKTGDIIIHFPARGQYGDIIRALQQNLNRTNIEGSTPTKGVKHLALYARKGSVAYNYIIADNIDEAELSNTPEAQLEQAESRKKIATQKRDRARAEKNKTQADYERLKAQVEAGGNDLNVSDSEVTKARNQMGESLEKMQKDPNNPKAKADYEKARVNYQNAQTRQKGVQSNLDKMGKELDVSTANLNAWQAALDEATLEEQQLKSNQQGERAAIEQSNQELTKQQQELTAKQAELEQAKLKLQQEIESYNAYCQKNNLTPEHHQQKLQEFNELEDKVKQAKATNNTAQSNRFYRAVNTPEVRLAILGFQLYNLNQSISNFNSDIASKGSTRGYLGVGGAFLDVTLAVEDVIANIYKHELKEIALRRIIGNPAATRLGSTLVRMGIPIASTFTIIAGFQVLAAAVLVVNSSIDLWYAVKWGDNAGVIAGNSLALAGGLVLLATPLIGWGPIGWVAFALIALGAILTYLFTTTELEKWLNNGPFADKPLSHLVEEVEAFYRLVGTFANIEVEVTALGKKALEQDKDYNKAAFEEADKKAQLPKNVSAVILNDRVIAGTRIRVTNELSGILASEVQTNIQFKVHKTSGRNTALDSDAQKYFQVRVERPITNGVEYLLDRPNFYYMWSVCAQYRTIHKGKTLCFPAPKVIESTPLYTEALTNPAYIQPEFNRGLLGGSNQAFWANEDTNKKS